MIETAKPEGTASPHELIVNFFNEVFGTSLKLRDDFLKLDSCGCDDCDDVVKDNNIIHFEEVADGYEAAIEVPGVSDITITAKDDGFVMEGENETFGYNCNVDRKVIIDPDIMAKTREITYKIKNGLLVVHFILEPSKIKVTSEN